MPTAPTAAQSAASRANGARSRGPNTDAGRARSARNGTRHGLRGGPFALLPDEDREAFAELHAAVTADWGPRDAYERRWVFELVACLWRQERLRGLEFAAFAAAESPPSEATIKRLLTFARYGARIDKDMAKALLALRSLRNRPDAWIDELRPNCTNELSPRTSEPEAREPHETKCTIEFQARTPEPEPTPAPVGRAPALNRYQRRALAAMRRKLAA